MTMLAEAPASDAVGPRLEATVRRHCWPILDEMPAGWILAPAVGSPVAGCVVISNGKSVISGQQQRALLAVRPRQSSLFDPDERAPTCQPAAAEPAAPAKPEDPATAQTVNEFARARLKHKLLADILVDLMICEIEGWCKREYIRDLRALLNGIALDGGVVTPNVAIKRLP